MLVSDSTGSVTANDRKISLFGFREIDSLSGYTFFFTFHCIAFFQFVK